MTRQCSCNHGRKHPKNLKTLVLFLLRRLPKFPDKPCPMCNMHERVQQITGFRQMTEKEWDDCDRKQQHNPWTQRNWNPPSWL